MMNDDLCKVCLADCGQCKIEISKKIEDTLCRLGAVGPSLVCSTCFPCVQEIGEFFNEIEENQEKIFKREPG